MAKNEHYYHNLLFLIIFICHSTCLSLSSSTQNLVMPMKLQKVSSHVSRSTTTSNDMLAFHRDVTLTVSLSVGRPPQKVTMVLDTGSELSWLHCNKTMNPKMAFNPVLSKSYVPIPCSSRVCETRTRDFQIPVSCDPNKLCHTIVSYADASSLEGNLASDFFSHGSKYPSRMLLGCMVSGQSSNPEEDSKTTGILGMNRGSLSFITQSGYKKFSYCISGSNSSGVLLFGDANFNWLKPLRYTSLVSISTPLPSFDRLAYSVQLEGIKVGNKTLPLPKSVFVPDHTGAGQTMIDSGSQFTFLLGSVYTPLKNEFASQTNGILKVLNDPNFVFQGTIDLCFLIPSDHSVLPKLPPITLMFSGAQMRVSDQRLLYKVPNMTRGRDLVYCFTFGNSDLLGIESFVIGNYHQQDMWVEFDLVNSRVGLAEVKCDLASRQLGLGSSETENIPSWFSFHRHGFMAIRNRRTYAMAKHHPSISSASSFISILKS